MPPTMDQTENPYRTRNVTFRMYALLVDLVHRAADATDKNLSDYIRDIIVPVAAKDLGEEPPELPRLKRGRYSSMIAQAAKAAGMSREDFEAMVLADAAAKMLAEAKGKAQHGSGERQAHRRLGVYTGTPGESTSVRTGSRRKTGG